MSTLVVIFFTRPGCHLCEEAKPLVERVAKRAGLTLEVVDIEVDDRLVADYGLRIPVVMAPDGSLLAEGRIENEAQLYRSLTKTIPGYRRWPRLRRVLR